MSEKIELLLGIDIGFGDIKAVFKIKNRKRELKFPTAVAKLPRATSIRGLENSQDIYKYNGIKYILADDALTSKTIISTRSIEFLKEYTPLLVFKTLQEVSKSLSVKIESLLTVKIKLCLGLPLEYFYKEKKCLQNSLKSFSIEHVKGEKSNNYNLTFDTIDVRAQGQGVLNDFIFDDMQDCRSEYIDSSMLIIDVGFNTIDILSIVNGKTSTYGSYMIEGKGICQICNDLHLVIKDDTGIDFPEQRIKQALTDKNISIRSQPKDLSHTIDEITKEYTDYILREITTRSSTEINNADIVIIAGGGAYYLGEHLSSHYPKGFIFCIQEPEYSNARGYLKKLEIMGHHYA